MHLIQSNNLCRHVLSKICPYIPGMWYIMYCGKFKQRFVKTYSIYAQQLTGLQSCSVLSLKSLVVKKLGSQYIAAVTAATNFSNPQVGHL